MSKNTISNRMAASFLALGALLASGCAVTIDNYHAIKTDNFTLYTNLESGRYGDTLRALEFSYASLGSVFFKNNEIGKVDVLFLDDPEFTALMGNFRQGAALAKVPGGGKETKIGQDGLLILHPFTMGMMGASSADLTGNAENAHEGSVAIVTPKLEHNAARFAANEMLSHIFIQRALPKAPLWFHEGFSSYVSTLEVRESADQTFSCFGHVQRTDGYMGLPKLWDMNFNGYVDSSARNWFRSTAYVFIDFTLHGENNAHRGALAPLVMGLSAGNPSRDVVKNAFGLQDLAGLDEKVTVHRAAIAEGMASGTNVRGQCPFGFVMPPERKPKDDFPVSSKVTPEDMEALFRALRALPAREEFPPYYPVEVIEGVTVPSKAEAG